MADAESAVASASVAEQAIKFGFLTTQYELLHLILSCLPMRDLNHAACVCKAWYKACKTIKKERSSLHWMHWHTSGHEKSIAAVRQAIGTANKAGEKCGKLPSIKPYLDTMLSEVYSEPKLCLMFITSSFLYCQEHLMMANSTVEEEMDNQMADGSSKYHVINYLKQALPQTSVKIGIASAGVIGTSRDLLYSLEIENEESFSMLMLPEVPEVKVRQFTIDEVKYFTLLNSKEQLNDRDLESLTGIGAREEVKCLLLLCNAVDIGGEAAKKVSSTLLHRQNKKIAIGGGFVDTLLLPNSHEEIIADNPYTVGITISGPNVKAASVIIQRSVKKQKGVESIMQELKNCHIPEENSFAFMFACVGRGKGFYKAQNVETVMFRKYFPNTPIVGFFGNGEIGVQYTPQFSTTDGGAGKNNLHVKVPFAGQRRKREELFHGYTTIIVLVSLGKGKRNREK